jgi:hypothetical protein
MDFSNWSQVLRNLVLCAVPVILYFTEVSDGIRKGVLFLLTGYSILKFIKNLRCFAS